MVEGDAQDGDGGLGGEPVSIGCRVEDPPDLRLLSLPSSSQIAMSPTIRDPAIESSPSAVSMTSARARDSVSRPVRGRRSAISVSATSAVHGSSRRYRVTSSRE
jgi:hypothetical protein